MKLGYACINSKLSSLPKAQRITTNRGMIRRTYLEKGIGYASELALMNVKDLYKIICWNEDNNVSFFRVSSDLFPWASEYELEDLPDFQEISLYLKKSGDLANKLGHRITTHPGPFNKLCAKDPRIVNNTVRELNYHAKVFDYMGLPATPYSKINIHVGAAYDCKDSTAYRFCKNFDLLSDTCKTRLTVENDDKASLWSTREIYESIYSNISTPIVFDYHHHQFCTGGQTEQQALVTAMSTWGGILPVVHYSQSRSEEHSDPKIKPQAHSDSYWSAPDFYNKDFDVMLECKHKEVGLEKMREILGK